MWPNMPSAPGMASIMLLSSPNSFRQRFFETRRWPSTSCNIVVKRVTLCCGRWIVPLTESITQPNSIFCVAHVLSPCFTFFSDAGSWSVGRYVGERGRSTSSSDCNRSRLTSSHLSLFPWVIPRKSSKKINIGQGIFGLYHSIVVDV